jgi:hypothetical protein
LSFFGLPAPDVYADDDIRVEGSIQHMGTDSLEVNHIIFYVDSNTEIRGQHGAVLQFSDLKVGDSVEVRANFTSGGYYLATRIELEDRGEELEVEGYIQEIYPDSFKVSGIILFVDNSVEVRGEHGQILQYSDLTVGHFVEVRAELRGAGNYFAYRIEVEREGDKIEFEGKIEALGNNSITVNTVVIEVGGDTQIRGNHGQTLTLNDLMVGDRVEVKAFLMPTGIYHAIRIKLEDNIEDEIEIKAPIDSIYADTLVVAGIKFWIDSLTIIIGDDHQPLNFSDLQVGFIVEIKGRPLPDGTHYAKRIKLEDFWQDEIEIQGEISTIGSDWLIVNDLKFFIDLHTIILDDNNILIPFSALQLGQIVEVKGRRQLDKSLLALRIKIERVDGRQLEMKGFIESISSGSIQVSGLVFMIDVNATILNHANLLISLNELKIGLFVEVKAFLQSDNTFLATRIKIEDDQNFVKISGIISNSTTNRVIISSTPVNLNNQTIFIDHQYYPISSSNITVGQKMTVWADFTNPSSPQGLQLKVNQAGNTTNISNDGIDVVTPTGFELLQNYPNPFNPTTKISFTLKNSAFVTLTVYNVLGEEMDVLINGFTAVGTHSVNFDASRIPSGFYFYTLSMEGIRQTRKMLLMR